MSTEVCFCMGITLEEIMDAIKNGACDLETIMEKTDVGTVCGLCKSPEEDTNNEREIHLTEILEQAKKEGLCK
ncbi:MAG: (2Fe-2S)-binding protein [Persephonella sp.]|nr:MAG: (2Fe-2S)-binding protein [Persephonella sp.]